MTSHHQHLEGLSAHLALRNSSMCGGGAKISGRQLAIPALDLGGWGTRGEWALIPYCIKKKKKPPDWRSK